MINRFETGSEGSIHHDVAKIPYNHDLLTQKVCLGKLNTVPIVQLKYTHLSDTLPLTHHCLNTRSLSSTLQGLSDTIFYSSAAASQLMHRLMGYVG